jgi:hypothetical protein
MTSYKMVVAAIMLAGCSANVSAEPAQSQDKGASVAGGAAGADSNSASEAIDEAGARKRALEFTSNKGWGEPTSVADTGKNWTVYFATPKRELSLLSQRAVLVNKATGETEFQRRR